MPVATVIVRAPTAAPASIFNVAVKVVGLVTRTGPNPPDAAPPTPIPAPKPACVAPCTNTVHFAVIDTVSDCPAEPDTGVAETRTGGGSTVKVDELPLWNPSVLELTLT